MNIHEIKYGATLKIAEYESERIDLSAIVADGESVEDAIKEMRRIVMTSAIKNGGGAVVVEEEHHITSETAVEGMTSSTMGLPTNETAIINKPVEETPAAVEAPQTEAEVKVKGKPGRKPKEPKAEKPPKTVPYDRTNDIHKTLITGLLDGINKDWKKVLRDKVAAASPKLVGVAFLSEEGEILQSFKDQLHELLK